MNSSVPPPGLSPAQIEWLMITANCLLVQKCPEPALTLLEFLLCHEPEHQQARQMLGYCHYLSGSYEATLSNLDNLGESFQNANPINTLLKAKALAALGREAEASESFEAFSLTPEQAP